MKKVLIVEGQELLIRQWKGKLNGMVEVVFARSIEDARAKLLDANLGFDAIVINAHVHGNTEEDIFDFVKEFTMQFCGSIIATSTSSSSRIKLVGVGCDQDCDESFVPGMICQVLGSSA